MASSRPSRLPVFLTAAELLAPADKDLVDRLTLAIDEPEQYLKVYREELAQRAVSTPVPRLALIALLDGLAAREQVALIDWKTPAEDVVDALKNIRGAPEIDWAWVRAFDEDELDDLSTERFLSAVAAEVESQKRGISLVNLDTGSDQFAIVLVTTDKANAVLAAMKATRHKAELVRPKPIAKPRPARRTQANQGGAAMAEWPVASEDAPGTWRYFLQPDRAQMVCLRKAEEAFDVISGPAHGDSTTQRRSFVSAEACNEGWVAEIETLRSGGYLQYTDTEHAKELRARTAAHNAAKRKKR